MTTGRTPAHELTWSPALYSHPFTTFRQQVRRHQPTALIPALARYAAAADVMTHGVDRTYYPWVVAAIARESVLYGNEHRDAPVTYKTIQQLHASFGQVHDTPQKDLTPEQVLIQHAYEQFPSQESLFQETARTTALLIDTPLADEAGPDVAHWPDLFGMDLDAALAATFTLWTWVKSNEGRYQPDLLDQPQLSELVAAIPRPEIEALAQRLTATIPELKADATTHPTQAGMERFAYNPLTRTPLIDLGPHGIWCPTPSLLLRNLSPGGLFYAGIERWGDAFARQLGHRFQAYIGRQLDTVGGTSLQPEIVYGKNNRRSADWILIHPQFVLIIECKSRRLPEDARLGGDTLTDVLQRTLNKGITQVNSTATLILGGAPEFASIPTDRPLWGAIITSEPFYIVNSNLIRQHLTPPDLPLKVLSARDLELLVTLDSAELHAALTPAFIDAEQLTWSLSTSLRTATEGRRNHMLDNAFSTSRLARAFGPHNLPGSPTTDPGVIG